MKVEPIIVPKGKSPLDVLAELGEQTRSSWIYLHDNVIQHLTKTADYLNIKDSAVKFIFDATEKSPKTIIRADYLGCKAWHNVQFIIADDIAFKMSAADPENIFFLKMEE